MPWAFIIAAAGPNILGHLHKKTRKTSLQLSKELQAQTAYQQAFLRYMEAHPPINSSIDGNPVSPGLGAQTQ